MASTRWRRFWTGRSPFPSGERRVQLVPQELAELGKRNIPFQPLVRAASHKSASPIPVRPELVEGPLFLSAPQNEGRCFDKLSTNGRKVMQIAARRSKPPPGRPPASIPLHREIGRASCRERVCQYV